MVELLMVVALVGILVAAAIPQFFSFKVKANRAEAVILLKAFHKGEKAYFIVSDSYYSHCPMPNMLLCTFQSNAQSMASGELNDEMGIGFIIQSNAGYIFNYIFYQPRFTDGTIRPKGFIINLSKDIDGTDAAEDTLTVGQSIDNLTSIYAGKEGIPFLFVDDLKI